jgi:hypothetical protein
MTVQVRLKWGFDRSIQTLYMGSPQRNRFGLFQFDRIIFITGKTLKYMNDCGSGTGTG